MDAHRFDELTRALAEGTTRRRVLRGLAGGALASAAALLGRSPAAAGGCKEVGKACKTGGQCCSGHCAPPTNSRSTAKSGSVCQPAPTTCPTTPCDQGFERDPQTCACDICPSGLTCSATLGVPQCCPSSTTCVCSTNSTGCQCFCPNGCSDHGSCDYVTGLCTCDAGFSGADCSVASCDALGETCQQSDPVTDLFGTCCDGLACYAGGCCIPPADDPRFTTIQTCVANADCCQIQDGTDCISGACVVRT